MLKHLEPDVLELHVFDDMLLLEMHPNIIFMGGQGIISRYGHS